MSRVELQVLGCGDAFGSGGRLHSSFLLTSNGGRLLVDCGATGLLAMRRFGVDPGSIGSIALTHLHGDHYSGLVFLLLEARHVSKRKAPLEIAGPPGLEARLMSTMELMFPGSTEIGYPFPLTFTELLAGVSTRVGDATVTPREVVHPSGAPSYALRVELGGRVVAFSGDTEWTDALLEVSRDADLFICECLHATPFPNYHIDYQTLLAKRPLLTCRRILLTHLGAPMLARAAAGQLELECAQDGMKVEVGEGKMERGGLSPE
jgi:ribonuclease BN (tRNA processing enzyme)